MFNGAEPLSNFGKELAKEHFCEIISKSIHWFSRLLCSHSPNDVPPEPQRNVSIAAERGAVRPSMTGLAEENFLLFIALVAILFNRAEQFEQFWWTVT